MSIDLTVGGRGNTAPDQKVQVINKEAVNDELRSETTAVLTFFLDASVAVTVDDIWHVIETYMTDQKILKSDKNNKMRLAADFRKVFWCVRQKRWKVINFYFNTPWIDAAKHGLNRELLEPYMGKGYKCDGATVGRIWSEEQSALSGCIKLCDISYEQGIVKYISNMKRIAKLLAQQLH